MPNKVKVKVKDVLHCVFLLMFRCFWLWFSYEGSDANVFSGCVVVLHSLSTALCLFVADTLFAVIGKRDPG
jgi:hypothetical protein